MHGCEQFNSCLRDTVIKKLFLLFSSSTLRKSRTSLVVQWLRHYASIVGGTDSVPGQGTKIPHATLCGKKKKNRKQKAKTQETKKQNKKRKSYIYNTLSSHSLQIPCHFPSLLTLECPRTQSSSLIYLPSQTCRTPFNLMNFNCHLPTDDSQIYMWTSFQIHITSAQSTLPCDTHRNLKHYTSHRISWIAP